MRINIFNLNKIKRLEKNLIKKLTLLILKKEKRKFDDINIIIADDDYLRELNKRYLKRNRTTNVIAFNLGDTGEVYLSKGQAHNENELLFFLAHGLLHLCGYDHKDRISERLMHEKCQKYLNRVALKKSHTI